MTDLTKLRAEMRAGLEGVTPGPWEYFPHIPTTWNEGGETAAMVNADGNKVIDCLWGSATEEGERLYRHIARCSPGNIRALLDALDAAERYRTENDYIILDLDAKLSDAERERDYGLTTADVADEMIRSRIPDRFLLDPPDGGDVKTWESVERIVAAMYKAEHERDEARRERDEARVVLHYSDCAVNNAPAFPPGPCDCGGVPVADEIERLRREVQEARAARATVWNDAIEAASDRLCIAHNECCDPARYDRGDCCGRFIPVQAAIRELKDRAP